MWESDCYVGCLLQNFGESRRDSDLIYLSDLLVDFHITDQRERDNAGVHGQEPFALRRLLLAKPSN